MRVCKEYFQPVMHLPNNDLRFDYKEDTDVYTVICVCVLKGQQFLFNAISQIVNGILHKGHTIEFATFEIYTF